MEIKFSYVASFTLTMWDVKKSLVADLLLVLECFTLTMWDVKVNKIEKKGTEARNYFKDAYEKFDFKQTIDRLERSCAND